MLSQRGEKVISSGGHMPPYVALHISTLNDAYHPETNPNGMINFAIAEDKLCQDIVSSMLLEKAVNRVVHSRQWNGYDDPRGGHQIRTAIARFLSNKGEEGDVEEDLSIPSSSQINPDDICIAAGLAAATELLFFAIADEGQGCLIPSPYFAGFDSDLLGGRTNVLPIPVMPPPSHSAVDINSTIEPSNLEKVFLEEEKTKNKVAAILLTNPHNPTGQIYSSKALMGAILWALDRGLHVVVDEVYAHSLWGERKDEEGEEVGGEDDSSSFVSAIDICDQLRLSESDRQRVHILFGFAKTFGVAGWRIGGVVSRHPGVKSVFSSLVHGCESSTLGLGIFHSILGEKEFAPSLEQCLQARNHRLKHTYEQVCHLLDEFSIPYLPANSGVFLMLDLRSFLPLYKNGEEGEEELLLWRDIATHAKINLTPGQSMHCRDSGYFRLCFAYPSSPEAVVEGVKRLGEFLKEKREGGR